MVSQRPSPSVSGLQGLVEGSETGSVEDWHYNGVESNPVPLANAVYLDASAEDYDAHVVGLFLQVSF